MTCKRSSFMAFITILVCSIILFAGDVVWVQEGVISNCLYTRYITCYFLILFSSTQCMRLIRQMNELPNEFGCKNNMSCIIDTGIKQ